jgi:hypothetical protein
LSRVAVCGGNEYLDDVLLPKGIVAIVVISDDFPVDALPLDVKILIVVTQRSSGGIIVSSVDIRE